MVPEGKSLQKYPVNAGVPQGSIPAPTLFPLYINYFPPDGICNIAIYADDTPFYLLHLIGGNNTSWPLNLNLIYWTV